MCEIFAAAFGRNGADLFIGRRLTELYRTVREHLDDPRTLVMPHLGFLVWGRKP